MASTTKCRYCDFCEIEVVEEDDDGGIEEEAVCRFSPPPSGLVREGAEMISTWPPLVDPDFDWCSHFTMTPKEPGE